MPTPKQQSLLQPTVKETERTKLRALADAIRAQIALKPWATGRTRS